MSGTAKRKRGSASASRIDELESTAKDAEYRATEMDYRLDALEELPVRVEKLESNFDELKNGTAEGRLPERVDELASDLGDAERRTFELDIRIDKLEELPACIDELKQNANDVECRVVDLDSRIDNAEDQVSNLPARVDELESIAGDTERTFDGVFERVEALEYTLGSDDEDEEYTLVSRVAALEAVNRKLTRRVVKSELRAARLHRAVAVLVKSHRKKQKPKKGKQEEAQDGCSKRRKRDN